MNRRTHEEQFGPRDRIAAFAEATEVYAEGLQDRALANVYWGKSLGLWQALTILTAGDLTPAGAAYLARGWEDLLIPEGEAPSLSPPAGAERHRERRAAAQHRTGRRP